MPKTNIANHVHVVEVWGDFACISRPELKVERWSYPCLTPSAARGIFDAIYFKPQFYWQVDNIELLREPAYIALRRNEVKDKVSVPAVLKWMQAKADPQPIWADADKAYTGTDTAGRTQRQTMAIRNPRYRLHAHIVPRAGCEDHRQSYDEQFTRRAVQGKCWQQPYLGLRECVAFFRYVDSLEGEPSPVGYSQDLGLMLYDVFDLRKINDSKTRPFITLFMAKIDHGILRVPPFDAQEVLKPEPSERRIA